MRNFLNWWAFVPGANWRHPTGPESAIAGLEQHPVVHVGFEDATAFVQWAGKALPTEAEWELAARGGLDQTEFAWGDELEPEGRAMANTWQGEFPYENLLGDGFETTSPVGTFPPNGWGLYDMIGNVWEWTTDWYTSGHRKPEEDASCCGGADKRTARERSYDPTVALPIPRKVIKGGSFLCAPNYCRRYRPAARMAQAIDTSTCHLGFRCIVREP
jgi:formylglycine-generating enzyme required for sulfatase activity